jgi:hypothetical protein
VSFNSISNFFAKKKPFKKYDLCEKQFFGKIGFFNCQKPSSFTVCGKKLVETI